MAESIRIDTLFIGHPRCGSAALAAGLREVGLDVQHERFGTAGMVSWWHAGFHDPTAGQGVFRQASQRIPAFQAGKIFHYLRRPSNALPSIQIENEYKGRENGSFRFRRRRIKEAFDVDLADMDPASAAIVSYVLWNRIAGSISDIARPILVEKPDFSLIAAHLFIENLPVRNTTAQKFGIQKEKKNLADLVKGAPKAFSDEIMEIEGLYDEVMKE